MNQRHTEFFGPDFARGPFASSNAETTAVQIAAAIAQLRAPLGRDEDSVLAHADFIRAVADHLMPHRATYVKVEIGENAFGKTIALRTNFPQRTLLRMWLADEVGGGESAVALNDFIVVEGGVVEEVATKKHWVVVTNAAGVASFAVDYAGAQDWQIGVARGSSVFYAGPLSFD